MTKLRVLQFGPTRWQGGVAAAIADLCLGLAKQGHEVGLLCNGGTVLDRLAGTNVQVFERSSVGGMRKMPSEVIPTRKILRSFRPDILHVHGRGPSLVSMLAGRYPDCFTLHNSTMQLTANFFDRGRIRRYFSPMARKIITLSAPGLAYCQTELRIHDERLFVIHNGVDVARYAPCDLTQRKKLRAEFGVGPDQLLVLFVGRFHPVKQPEAIVRLADALRARGNERVRFVMMGDGPLKSTVSDMISSLGLQDRVTLLEFQDPLFAYQAADLLVMPSTTEGFPLVAIEAMAAGCPVLRSRTGGFEESIEEGETGFGCGVEIDDFIAKAISILEHPENLPRIATRARAKIVAELSLEAQVRATTEVYRAVLSYRR
ncbi:MAG: glycosyltransferase family 4 protein [Alkalilacustris sp.]